MSDWRAIPASRRARWLEANNGRGLYDGFSKKQNEAKNGGQRDSIHVKMLEVQQMPSISKRQN
jgi:hypothetical protein